MLSCADRGLVIRVPEYRHGASFSFNGPKLYQASYHVILLVVLQAHPAQLYISRLIHTPILRTVTKWLIMNCWKNDEGQQDAVERDDQLERGHQTSHLSPLHHFVISDRRIVRRCG